MTITLPDGREVTEIVLPDGSTATQVIAPDGSVVFDAGSAIPDSATHQYIADVSATPSQFDDQIGTANLTGTASSVITDAVNGYDALRFDGVDDEMDTTSFTHTAPYAVAAVYVQQGTSTDGHIWADTSTHPSLQLNSGSYQVNDGPSITSVGDTVQGSAVLIMWEVLSSSSTDNFWINNTEYNPSLSTNPNELDGLLLAARSDLSDFKLEGDYTEVVVYDSPSSSELSNERSRLIDKYGL